MRRCCLLAALVAATLPVSVRADDAADCRAALAEANRLNDAGKFRDALPVYERALALAERAFGDESLEVAKCLNGLGHVCWRLGQYARAEGLYRRDLAITEAAFGKDHPATARSVFNVAAQLHARGDHAAAEPLYLRALAVREARLGPDHPVTATSLNSLAGLYRVEGRYDKAEPLYRRALAIREKAQGLDHPETATVLNNLSLLCVNLGRYAEAERLARRCLSVREKALPPGHPDVAKSMNNLATVYLVTGRHAEAEDLYRRCLALRETSLGPDHVETANTRIGLAVELLSRRRLDEAADLYRRAAVALEASLGESNSQAVRAREGLACALEMSGKREAAEAILRRCVAARESSLGPDHPETAQSLAMLGRHCMARDRFDEAGPLFRRSLAVLERRLGPDHPRTGLAHVDLGFYLYRCREWDRAADHLDRALAALDARLGPDHWETMRAAFVRVWVDVQRERWGAALDLGDAERRRFRTHLARRLPALPAAEQLGLLGDFGRERTMGLLTMALEAADPAHGAARRTAEWLVNTKALTADALTANVRLARDAGPEREAEAAELRDVRQRLSRLGFAPAARAADVARALTGLAARERELVLRVGAAAGREDGTGPWASLDRVRAALPGDAAFVDLLKLTPFNLRTRDGGDLWRPARYVAWVVPPAGKGDVRVLDLGEAAPIDAAVAALRRQLDPARVVEAVQAGGEAGAEREWRRAASAVSDAVVRPLRAAAGGASTWVVSPDADLWLVPWAALPDGGRYLAEAVQLRFVVSGRDLGTRAAHEGMRNQDPSAQAASALVAGPLPFLPPSAFRRPRPVIFADPDFAGAAAAGGDSVALTRGVTLADRLPAAWPRLAGTGREAEAVAPRLARWAGREPVVLRGGAASKAAFRALKGPAALVVCTHGFFLPAPEARPIAPPFAPRPDDAPPSVDPLADPLLRCGLVLAGADRQASGDGGVLTGYDVAGTDLRGCELVVLSACETGVGQVHVGEGVAGLRQAFQLAGARSVLASLWQVPDRETAALMEDLFDRLALGASKAEALRQAQLARIADRRKSGGAEHPFFWAAFTLTGD